MALSQMGVPGHTSGSDGVYRRSADSGITEIDAAGRYSWSDTFYCPAGPRWAPWCRSAECQRRTELTQRCAYHGGNNQLFIPNDRLTILKSNNKLEVH